MYSHYENFLKSQQDKKLLRSLKAETKDVKDFSSNDYLNLSNHPILIEAAIKYSKKYGVGGQASRIVRNLDIYNKLEEKIAISKNKEAALIFPSGFQANFSVLSALLDKNILKCEPLVFSDKLNHASIHHGCFLAGVRQIRYNNIDLNHLEDKLKEHANITSPKFIITESVFSMDGTKIDLKNLAYLSKKYGCFLYVDEAHSTGLYGSDGYGMTSDYADLVDVAMGTFSKAIGVVGGYVACSSSLKDYLINRSMGFICTTALSPSNIGAINAAWDLLPNLSFEREKLLANSLYLRNRLKDEGFSLIEADSNIIAVVIGEEEKTLDLQKYLFENGIVVGAIRPPIVPPMTSRLRISLNTGHRQEDLDYLITHLRKWKIFG